VSRSETTRKVSHRQPVQVGDYKAENIPAGQNRMPIEVQVRRSPHGAFPSIAREQKGMR